MLTIENLKNSQIYKNFISGEVVLIHNPYYDTDKKGKENTYIVIHSDRNTYRITRFWISPNRRDQLDRIHASIDYTGLSAKETFQILLSEYSRGLA